MKVNAHFAEHQRMKEQFQELLWAAGNRGSGSSESDIPPEISIYSDSGWYSSEPNVRLEEYNYNEGQLSNIPLDVHASVVTTDGQLRNLLYLIWN